MSWMDSINQIFEVKLLGIPVVILFAVMIFAFWFLLKYRKAEGRKRLNLIKEVGNDFNLMYRTFGERLGKKLYAGFVEVGYAIGSYPIYWDKFTSARANVKSSKQLKNFVASQSKEGKNIEEMTCFKMAHKGLLSKALAALGFKTYFMIVPTKNIDMNKTISIPASLQGQEFLGIMIYTKTARDYVENIAFKLNRQEELTEIADFIPKQNYLEVTTATSVAKAREKAQIEKEKYRGQIEGAEDA